MKSSHHKSSDSKHFWLKTISKPHIPKLFKGSIHIDDDCLLMITLQQGKITVLRFELGDFSLKEKFSLNIEECKKFDPFMLHSESLYFHKRLYFILNADPKEQEHIMIGDLSYKKLFPISNGDEGPSQFRFNYTATLFGFSILLFGGLTENLEPLNILDAFDIITYTWKNLKTKGKPPSPRHSHSAFVHDDNFFVMGGTHASDYFEKEMLFEDLYVLNMTSLSWTPIKTSGNIPKSLAFTYALEYSSKAVLILWSLADGNEEYLNASVLDVVNYEWDEPSRFTESPFFRYGAGVAWDKNSKTLYFCGGFSFGRAEELCYSKEIDRLLIFEEEDFGKSIKGLQFFKDEKINFDTGVLLKRNSSSAEEKKSKSSKEINFRADFEKGEDEDLTFEELLAREKEMMEVEKVSTDDAKKKTKKKKRKK